MEDKAQAAAAQKASIVRFEMLEAMARLAQAKFCKALPPSEAPSLAEATSRLIEQHVLASLSEDVFSDANVFREAQLYTPPIARMLEEELPLLQDRALNAHQRLSGSA